MPPPDKPNPAVPRAVEAELLQLWMQTGALTKDINLLFSLLADIAEVVGTRPPEGGRTLKQSIAVQRLRHRDQVARDMEATDPAAAARFQQDMGRNLPPIDG